MKISKIQFLSLYIKVRNPIICETKQKIKQNKIQFIHELIRINFVIIEAISPLIFMLKRL